MYNSVLPIRKLHYVILKQSHHINPTKNLIILSIMKHPSFSKLSKVRYVWRKIAFLHHFQQLYIPYYIESRILFFILSDKFNAIAILLKQSNEKFDFRNGYTFVSKINMLKIASVIHQSRITMRKLFFVYLECIS